MTTYKELFADEPTLAELMENAAISQDKRVNANTKGHVWKLNEFNHVKINGGDFHNTVTCANCGYTYCIACHDIPPKPCKK